MAQALVKLRRKDQMVIPRSLREEAGILLTPRFTLDRPIVASGKEDRKKLLKELAQAVAELREDAAARGLDTMSAREISAAVSAARRVPKQTAKHPRK